MTHHPTIDLARQLIQQPSITPNDYGCQTMIANHLDALGFSITHLPCESVSNLWAKRGSTSPVFVFAGHTDVVPPGDTHAWSYPPFEADVVDGQLIGRGAADMKGAIAAMLVATQRFVTKHPEHRGSIAFLITSDEEGPALHGTQHVVAHLQRIGQPMDCCVVGEASSETKVGDTIKVGRRGSLHANLTVKGQQGHVAYPNRAINPIPGMALLLNALSGISWDAGDADFPPTNCQISNVHAGDGTENMVPGQASAKINWRFSPISSPESIQAAAMAAWQSVGLPDGISWSVDWRCAAEPFKRADEAFLASCDRAIASVTGETPEHSTSGGTSDGRFIAPTGCQVIELGVGNATIHQVDEQVAVEDLITLTDMYEALLVQCLV